MKLILAFMAFIGGMAGLAWGFIGLGSMITTQTWPWQVQVASYSAIGTGIFLIGSFAAFVYANGRGGKTIVVKEGGSLNVGELALKKKQIASEAAEEQARIDAQVIERKKAVEIEQKKIEEFFNETK